MKMVQKSKTIQSASEIMTDYWATESEVGEAAAVKIFVEMYGGKDGSLLRKLQKYRQMLLDGIIEPQKLAPSERAAYFHGLRVHLQIIEWKMLDETLNLDPRAWGWKLDDNCLVPIPTDKNVAPPSILKVIRCNCKSNSKNPCGTNVCSCIKNGLKCMSACGGCHGEDCNNKADEHMKDDDVSDGDTDEFDEFDGIEERNAFDDIF